MYVPKEPAPTSLSDCIKLLDNKEIHSSTSMRKGVSPALLNDDCENCAQGCMQLAEGIRALVSEFDTPQKLASAMAQEAHENPLFPGFTMEHHMKMATGLHRLGVLLETGKWCTGFSVVSARGPACSQDAQSAGAVGPLSGHGTLLSRCEDGAGNYIYGACEGTSYIMCQVPPASGLATTIQLGLRDGTSQPFNLAEVPTVFAQNMYEVAGLSPNHRVLGQLLSTYPDKAQSPFYVSCFYSGLQQGDKTFGCVPLDARMAGTAPMFGAPVLDLSANTSIAIPLGAEMLGVKSKEEGKAIMQLICNQASEIFQPAATPSQIHVLMSHWHPCEAPPLEGASIDPRTTLRAECTSAFDDPAHVRAAHQVNMAVAASFNELQAANPLDDKVRMTAYAAYLSAALKIQIPIPLAANAQFKSTTMASLRAAVEKLGIQGITMGATKMAHVDSQAQIATDHHFFMCQNGRGLVHSHAVKLE